MMGYIFIGFITLVGIVIIAYAFCEEPSVCSVTIFGSVLVLSVTLYLISLGNVSEPRAIDVYRNKTTLQITYQDSIPVDTVVVWKDEFKK